MTNPFFCRMGIVMHIHRAVRTLVVAIVGALSVSTGNAANLRGVINLQVLDEAGVPQANASINLFQFDQDWRYWKKSDREVRCDLAGNATCDKLSTEEAYVVRVTSDDQRVGYRECILSDDSPRQELVLTVQRPQETPIQVTDDKGHAINGAKIWQVDLNGANGTIRFDWRSLDSYGLTAEASNAQGELQLPALPPGTMSVRLLHPEFAPSELKEVKVGQKDAQVAELVRGVKLTLQLKMENQEGPVKAVMIDCRHYPFDHPSTLIGQLPTVHGGRVVELTVAPGNYEQVRLTHPRYAITPYYAERYGHSLADPSEPMDIQAGHNMLTFCLKPKVKVRGHVLRDTTGEPVVGESVEGSLAADADAGPLKRFARKWSHIDWGETGNQGDYELSLAAGRARVSFQGQGLVAEPDHFDLEIRADGSTVVPDFHVRAIPKVQGVVLDENGDPLANAVVRFRGSMLTYAVQPVATDSQGRFELAPPFIPEDLQTHERLPRQRLLAFDPYKPMAADTEVRLDDSHSLAEVVLQMKLEEKDLLSETFSDDFSALQRGVIQSEEQSRLAKMSLVGKPAPELDGAQWLNTDGRLMSLSDYRGKYVLLQFWTTWCGPCHRDMPMVRLLEKLYRDRGLVVIGIHDNSMPLAAIKEDVAKQQLTYPIIVDREDGRILARYNEHGVSGYPSYILIGPDGLVLKDDTTVPGPSLRAFKIEIVRQLLMKRGDRG